MLICYHGQQFHLDLSPIEHVWDEMERWLRHLPNQPVTLAEMGPALIRIWNNIPQAFFNNLVRSMRRRCQACINANGGHTCYWLCYCLKSLVLFKTFTKLIQVTLNVIGLMVWWKMHYSTIYCTQLINFILILIFNWFFSNAQFLFSTSILKNSVKVSIMTTYQSVMPTNKSPTINWEILAVFSREACT